MIVDPETGWIEGVRRVESPNYDERPARCRARPDRRAWHQPAARRVRQRLDRPVLLQRAAGRSPSVLRDGLRRHGVVARADRARRRADAVRAVRPPRLARRPIRSTAGARRATIFRSASSSKARTTCRTRASNIGRWRSSLSRCGAAIRRSRPRRSSATATSRPAARRTRGRRSIGRSSNASSRSQAAT